MVCVLGGRLERGADIHAAYSGPDHRGEPEDDFVVFGDLLDIPPPGYRDAVLGALELSVEIAKGLTGLEIRVSLDRDQEPRERPAELLLGLLELPEGGGVVEDCFVDLHACNSGAGFDHRGQRFLLEIRRAFHDVHQVGNEVGPTLVLILDFGPRRLNSLILIDHGIVTTGRGKCGHCQDRAKVLQLIDGHSGETKHLAPGVKRGECLITACHHAQTRAMATDAKALARKAGKNIRRIAIAGFLASWTTGWGLISLVGWAARSPAILYTGFGMLAGGWAISTLVWAASRRRLHARAQRSLIARADLRGVALTDGMSARLHVFDDAYQQLQSALNDPSLPHADRSAEVTAELTGAQDELYRLVERYAVVKQEMGELGQYASTELVLQTRDEKQVELTRIDHEAEELVKQTRALAATAEQVRALASSRSSETSERLKAAIDQFNLTLAAYREVEAVSSPRRRKIQSQSL